jgi:predicted dehydrogenase
MVRTMQMFRIPYQVVAIADPRAAEVQGQGDPFLANATFYTDADELLAHADLDGVMIGTRCLHYLIQLRLFFVDNLRDEALAVDGL